MALGARIALDPLEHFQPVHLGQFQVEQDHLGRVLDLARGVRAFAENELQRLRAVAGDLDAIRELGFAQGAQRQFQVLRVVFDQQDFNGCGFVHGLVSPSRVK